MVKPAMPYLDIIASAAELAPDHPLACYQVSGEYAMIVAGATAGVYDLKTMAFESMDSMLRAGEYTDIDTKLMRASLDPTARCDAGAVVLHSSVFGLAGSVIPNRHAH